VRDLEELGGGEVSDDTAVDCLLTGECPKVEAVKEYLVGENRELRMSLVDLSDADYDVVMRFRLRRGASCIVNMASVCPEGRRKVFSVDMIHEEGGTFSRSKMAGINLGEGTLFFYGTSDVLNGARGSDTRQEGKITNLSPGSRSEVSPALLIKDNEVNASHGAALGAYDPAAMYYMMSRGLTESESRRLITIGSLVPVIDSLEDRDLAAEAMESLEVLEI